jgi:hypothetical protein
VGGCACIATATAAAAALTDLFYCRPSRYYSRAHTRTQETRRLTFLFSYFFVLCLCWLKLNEKEKKKTKRKKRTTAAFCCVALLRELSPRSSAPARLNGQAGPLALPLEVPVHLWFARTFLGPDIKFVNQVINQEDARVCDLLPKPFPPISVEVIDQQSDVVFIIFVSFVSITKAK